MALLPHTLDQTLQLRLLPPFDPIQPLLGTTSRRTATTSTTFGQRLDGLEEVDALRARAVEGVDEGVGELACPVEGVPVVALYRKNSMQRFPSVSKLEISATLLA